MPEQLARNPEQPGGFKKRNAIAVLVLALLLVVFFFLALMVGSSHMSLGESLQALFGSGTQAAVRIVQQIRLPRALAALIAGAGLSVSGLIMQSTLKNPMASPATLGVSNAAVFGANLAIIAMAGWSLQTGHNVDNYGNGANPFAVSSLAFIFAMASTLVVLGLCRIRSFSSETVVLAGIALGTVWTALTTLVQFYATDVGLSAAVIWTWGDLGRATYETDWIMLGVVAASVIVFLLLRWRYNAIAGGDDVAKSLGIRVSLLRFVSLLLASLITATVVSFLGIIGFVGIICPHAMKRIVGNNHRILIPTSLLAGSVLLLFSDIISRLIGNGTALPIGAITALLGGPFFLYLIFAKKGERA